MVNVKGMSVFYREDSSGAVKSLEEGVTENEKEALLLTDVLYDFEVTFVEHD